MKESYELLKNFYRDPWVPIFKDMCQLNMGGFKIHGCSQTMDLGFPVFEDSDYTLWQRPKRVRDSWKVVRPVGAQETLLFTPAPQLAPALG